jgi:hypothetical protein
MMPSFAESPGREFAARKVPLWVKVAFTLFVAGGEACYLTRHSVTHFLWFCHVAMVVAVLALWLESSLLASMQAVSVMLPLLVWNVDFVGRLLTGRSVLGVSDYMWDPTLPWLEWGISLFHVWLPWFLLWLVGRLGYDRRAWAAQTVLAWCVLLVCFFLNTNINGAHGLVGPLAAQTVMPPALWLALLLVSCPVWLYPCHLGLRALLGRPKGQPGVAPGQRSVSENPS